MTKCLKESNAQTHITGQTKLSPSNLQSPLQLPTTPKVPPDWFLGPSTKGLHMIHSCPRQCKTPPPEEVSGHFPLNLNPLNSLFHGFPQLPRDQDYDHSFGKQTLKLKQSSLIIAPTGGDILLLNYLLLSFLSLFSLSLYIFLSDLYTSMFSYYYR